MKTSYSIRIFQESDEKQLPKLLEETFGFSEDFWQWKHKSHPHFTPSSITIAEQDGKIIGSSSWIPRDLKISSSLVVRSAAGGDTAVAPEYRGLGIGSRIMKFFDEKLSENQVTVVTGFATQAVAKKFYAPLGSILMRDSTTTYTKYLNCDQWKERIQLIGTKNEEMARRLSGTKLRIKFALNGAPTFTMCIEDGAVRLEEVNETSSFNANVTIKGELGTLLPFFQGEKGTLDLLKLMLRRKVRTKGVLCNSRKLLRAMKAIAPLFKQSSH